MPRYQTIFKQGGTKQGGINNKILNAHTLTSEKPVDAGAGAANDGGGTMPRAAMREGCTMGAGSGAGAAVI